MEGNQGDANAQLEDDPNFRQLKLIDTVAPHQSSSSEEDIIVGEEHGNIKFSGEEIL